MKRLALNTVLSLFSGWLALVDHCLITVADMPVTGEIVVLLLLQASIVAIVMLLANGALPSVVEMASGGLSFRMKFFVLGLPLILLFISPFMISDSMYRAQSGSTNKFVVHARAWHDLACCSNPFSAHPIN
jgi:hypothetical protein